jgi:nucleoside-diphosphate-sugar epimerase
VAEIEPPLSGRAQRRRVLVTGGSGFVGGALVARLAADKRYTVRTALRRPMPGLAGSVEQTTIGDLAQTIDWQPALAGTDVVIHTAARVHVMDERASDPLRAFRLVNVDATLHLARQAAARGVRRFIFLSSIKVNGETTARGQPFRADDAPAPKDAYGISKLEAEQGLHSLARTSGMQVVVIRAPLVYGPGVKANFARLMQLLDRGVPLPFGAIDNRRTLVALDNLVDLIVTCIDHPAAGNQTFLAGDAEDLSTTDLLRRLGRALNKPARLIPIPGGWIECAARLLGRHAIADRLCGSLQVDIGKSAALLGWHPPLDVDAGLLRTATAWRSRR